MRDVVFVLVTVGFFLLAAAYVSFCDRVVRAEEAPGPAPAPAPAPDEAGRQRVAAP